MNGIPGVGRRGGQRPIGVRKCSVKLDLATRGSHSGTPSQPLTEFQSQFQHWPKFSLSHNYLIFKNWLIFFADLQLIQHLFDVYFLQF